MGLVISRKKDEKIFIADNITIQIVDIRADKVRLKIDAPADVPVDRMEVWIQKREAAAEAEKKKGGEK